MICVFINFCIHHGNPQPSFLGVITHNLGCKTFIFHSFGVQGYKYVYTRLLQEPAVDFWPWFSPPKNKNFFETCKFNSFKTESLYMYWEGNFSGGKLLNFGKVFQKSIYSTVKASEYGRPTSQKPEMVLECPSHLPWNSQLEHANCRQT